VDYITKGEIMPVKDPKELFLLMLSDLRQGTERTTKIFEEISQMVQDPDVKEALEARVFVSQKILSTLDQCFKLIGEQPVKRSGRLYEVFAEDFRRELAEMQNPTVRKLFILAKASHLLHLRIAEYKALIAAADLSGHYAVGVLLESCLADKLAFAERTQRFIRAIAETKVAEKLAARSVA
jgi:ferritin-like metal-binding protein YciE